MCCFAVVELLITNDADVNAVDEINQSSQAHPPHGMDTYVVRLLVIHGTNVKVLESDQRTALANAAGTGHYQISVQETLM